MDEKQWEESCQLSQDADDNFDWRIGHQSETPGAGPPADHSPGQYPLCTLKLYVYTTSAPNKTTFPPERPFCGRQDDIKNYYK